MHSSVPRLQPKRVFETVKNINLMRQRSQGHSPMNIPGSNQTSGLPSGRSSSLGTPHSSVYGGEGGGGVDNRISSILESPDNG